jgi:hypothetical protein
MITTTFDTHSLVKELQSSGIAEAQAEAIINVVQKVNADNDRNYSSKTETIQFKSELKHDFTQFKSEMKHEFASLENKFTLFENKVAHDMVSLEQRIIIKVGAMIMALGGVLIAIKFFG